MRDNLVVPLLLVLWAIFQGCRVTRRDAVANYRERLRGERRRAEQSEDE